MIALAERARNEGIGHAYSAEVPAGEGVQIGRKLNAL